MELAVDCQMRRSKMSLKPSSSSLGGVKNSIFKRREGQELNSKHKTFMAKQQEQLV
jgi:hypothetical protein